MTTRTAEGGRVLIVDDDPSFADTFAHVLRTVGMVPRIAGTAEEGLRLARARPAPEAIVLDVLLPDAEGTTILGALRRASPYSPVIIMTGHASLESSIAAVNEGAYAYLIKGSPAEGILSVVQRAVELRRLGRMKRALKRRVTEAKRLMTAVMRFTAAAIVAVRVDDGRIELWNPSMTRLTGFAPSEVPDLARWSALAAGLAGHDELIPSLGACDTSLPSIPLELALASRTGDVRSIVAILSTVLRPDGKAWLRLATIHDVTALRAMERRLRRAEKLALLGEFSGALAHEVRTPLAAVRSAIEVTRDDPEIPPRRRSILDDALGLIDRLARTAHDLLALGNPLELNLISCSFSDLVAATLSELASDPLFASIEIVQRDASAGSALAVDPGSLSLALQNLMRNAAQAMAGRGHIVVSAENEGEGKLLVAVEDEGPGIPPRVFERLFEPFVTARPGGTGLGLTIARKIVEAHGGDIRARSRSPSGARFELRLPAVAVAGRVTAS